MKKVLFLIFIIFSQMLHCKVHSVSSEEEMFNALDEIFTRYHLSLNSFNASDIDDISLSALKEKYARAKRRVASETILASNISFYAEYQTPSQIFNLTAYFSNVQFNNPLIIEGFTKIRKRKEAEKPLKSDFTNEDDYFNALEELEGERAEDYYDVKEMKWDPFFVVVQEETNRARLIRYSFVLEESKDRVYFFFEPIILDGTDFYIFKSLNKGTLRMRFDINFEGTYLSSKEASDMINTFRIKVLVYKVVFYDAISNKVLHEVVIL